VVVEELTAATVGTVFVFEIGIVVATVAAGSGLRRYEGIPLAQGSPIPDWSYSHRSSRGRAPRVGATCHHVAHTPVQASP